MTKTVRFAVVSDLHYRMNPDAGSCRPAATLEGRLPDPVEKLNEYLNNNRASLDDGQGNIADYLVCPGDIGDMANKDAFEEGWKQLKNLQQTLGAKHLVVSTGNHEVISRASPISDTAGNVVAEIDPLQVLQRHLDYPSSLIEPAERRWIYWGRGYEIIEKDNVFWLLVNSSHFHFTTRANEYERGRIGEVALETLKDELKSKVRRDDHRIFVMLIHHHPIPHESLDVDLGRIPMTNGPSLMRVLSECGVAWLVIHGHKHFPRLIRSHDEGPGKSILLAAGSVGTELSGAIATHTRLQFYIIEADVLAQPTEPVAKGRLRAFSWVDNDWQPSRKTNQGIPDRCGYAIPEKSASDLAAIIKQTASAAGSYLTWDEIIKMSPLLGSVLPPDCENLRRALSAINVKTTWPENEYFPTDVSV